MWKQWGWREDWEVEPAEGPMVRCGAEHGTVTLRQDRLRKEQAEVQISEVSVCPGGSRVGVPGEGLAGHRVAIPEGQGRGPTQPAGGDLAEWVAEAVGPGRILRSLAVGSRAQKERGG